MAPLFYSMKRIVLLLLASVGISAPLPEFRVPSYTAYIATPPGARVSRDHGVSDWQQPGTSILWFGEFKAAGKVAAEVELKLPKGDSLRLRLTVSVA